MINQENEAQTYKNFLDNANEKEDLAENAEFLSKEKDKKQTQKNSNKQLEKYNNIVFNPSIVANNSVLNKCSSLTPEIGKRNDNDDANNTNQRFCLRKRKNVDYRQSPKNDEFDLEFSSEISSDCKMKLTKTKKQPWQKYDEIFYCKLLLLIYYYH